ncbi:34969_t:CDS:1, partial [Gigaspora margarita]
YSNNYSYLNKYINSNNYYSNNKKSDSEVKYGFPTKILIVEEAVKNQITGF